MCLKYVYDTCMGCVIMFKSDEQYNQIKRDLDEILTTDEKLDRTIVIPAIFAHAMVLAKMRESKILED